VLVFGLCLPWIFSLTLASAETRTVGTMLHASWWGNGPVHPAALFWLVAGTIALSVVITSPVSGSETTADRRACRWMIAAVAMTVAMTAVVQAWLVRGHVSVRGGAAAVVAAANAAAGRYALLTWTVLLLALALGGALGWSLPGRGGRRGRRQLAAAGACALVLAVAGLVVQRANIDPIRADSALKAASNMAARGGFEPALQLLERAVRLAPREPMYALMRGRTALSAADQAPDGPARERLLELAESSLVRARDLAPLDPDHHANLARCSVRRALESTDHDRRGRLLERAVAGYRAALGLRPTSVLLLNEYGRLLINMGRRGEARRVLERAIALDPLFTKPAAALAALERVEATDESTD
jgi:tetratricopeptide (TPR) repeat protein